MEHRPPTWASYTVISSRRACAAIATGTFFEREMSRRSRSPRVLTCRARSAFSAAARKALLPGFYLGDVQPVLARGLHHRRLTPDDAQHQLHAALRRPSQHVLGNIRHCDPPLTRPCCRPVPMLERACRWVQRISPATAVVRWPQEQAARSRGRCAAGGGCTPAGTT